ncbi:MAG: hypothetical protein U9N32_00270 [Spirochaetota bacterium]|nr:hypothetical protein [Spirochaetota bacterium]
MDIINNIVEWAEYILWALAIVNIIVGISSGIYSYVTDKEIWDKLDDWHWSMLILLAPAVYIHAFTHTLLTIRKD